MTMKQPTLSQKILWMGLPALVMFLLIAGNIFYQHKFNPAPVFPHAPVTIERANGGGPLKYNMEIATTPEQQTYGLMYRKSLPTTSGMLFVWKQDRPIAMWMKNTFLPLDMLFIRRDGVIEKIITHAIPFDLTPLPSGEPVRGVIEIGGGEAGRLGIQVGDKVDFPAFSGAP